MDVDEIVVRLLLSEHPLYAPWQHVHVIKNDGKVFVGWKTTFEVIGQKPVGERTGIAVINHDELTKLHVEIGGDTCYGLTLQLAKRFRGAGWGLKLYEITEDIGRHFKCKWMQRTPSGLTHTGEHRADYLRRKLGYDWAPGYAQDYGVMRKSLL